MVLDDLSIFEELLFLLSGAAFGLEEGSGKLTKDVSILSHKKACIFDVLLLVAGWLHLVFLHINQRINKYQRSIV